MAKKRREAPAGKKWMFAMRKEMLALSHRPFDRLQFLLKWAAFRRKRVDLRTSKELRSAYKRGNPRGLTLVSQCWACSGWADVFTHHIVQLQHGGTNNQLNLVRICGECHRVVHPWLAKPKEATQHAMQDTDIVPF